MFENFSLANGTKVILVPQKDTMSATTMVNYPVGSRFETEKMSGVSHYIEHLMFKGTKHRKNTQTLTREIDRLGAEYNAFTGKEMTAYYIKSDAHHLEISLDILSDMLNNSLFEEKEMEREKTVVVEELRMYEDNPMMNIDTLFENTLYNGCPLGRDIGGTPKHVMSYGRNDVLAYKDKYYRPSNSTIVIAGKIPTDIRTILDKYFGDYPAAKNKTSAFSKAVIKSVEKSKRIAVKTKSTDQAQLMLGFPAFNHRDKRNTAVTVLNTILGGSMSSRLFIQIRERRGLAYMVKSGAEHFRDAGYVYIRAGLEVKNINKAIGVVLSEIKKMSDKSVSKKELQDAKTHIRGAMTLSLEDSSSQASWYAEEAMFMDGIETPDEWLTGVDAVTAEDVRKIASEVFDLNRMRVAIIGDVTRENVKF